MTPGNWFAKLVEKLRSLTNTNTVPPANGPGPYGPPGPAPQQVQVTRVPSGPQGHANGFGVIHVHAIRPDPPTSPDVTGMVVATGVVLFLLVAVFLFWEPIASLFGGCLHTLGGAIADARDNGRYRSLQRTVEKRLTQAQKGLDRLEADYLVMDGRFQAIVGKSLGSAVADPPQPLRSAIYTRADVSEAWYNVRKTAAALDDIPVRQAQLDEIAACIGHETLDQGHPYQVQQIIDWTSATHEALKTIDFAFLRRDTTYRPNSVIPALQQAERRQTR